MRGVPGRCAVSSRYGDFTHQSFRAPVEAHFAVQPSNHFFHYARTEAMAAVRSEISRRSFSGLRWVTLRRRELTRHRLVDLPLTLRERNRGDGGTARAHLPERISHVAD